MDTTIGLYIVGVLSLLGGIELVRFSWKDSGTEAETAGYGSFGGIDKSTQDLQPATLGVTLGLMMVVFSFVAFYGGYSGWTIGKILSTVYSIAEKYLL